MNQSHLRSLAIAAVVTASVSASALMFENYGWQTGSTAPYSGTFTPNGTVANWGLAILDIDGGGPLGTTMTYYGQHGQAVFNAGVPAGVNIFQSINLIDNCAYQVEYDWAANAPGAGNAEGGIFDVIVDGVAIATQSSGGIAGGGFESDHIVGRFKNSGTGSHAIGARITRPFILPADLQQWLDNFSICPIFWDGDFGSGLTTNWTYPDTGNGSSLTITNVPAGAAPNSPLGSGRAIRLQVGQITFNPGVYEGISVGQLIHLSPYTSYKLSADVGATSTATPPTGNAEGGRFQLFVGGALVGANWAAGSIDGGTSETSTIEGTINLGAAGGSFFSGVRVTRPFIAPTDLWQYVDNIRLEKHYATISGRVFLQAWDGLYTYPPLEIYVVRDGAVREEHEINMDADGNYSFNTAIRGPVDVWVKSTHWLAEKRMNIPFNDSGLTGLNFGLRNGDANPDNEVNLVDAGRISAAFGTAVGDPGYDWWADLNGDEEVNLVDWGIMSANFGNIGDDVL